MRNEFVEYMKGIAKNNIILNPNKKVADVLPNESAGIKLLGKNNADEMIDRMVEEPLRKACKDLTRKGIETVMSSANKNNVLKDGEKALEREDVKGRQFYLDAPTFEDAGRGYAWIMLNYDGLSSENKEMLFSLEQMKSSDGDDIGEKTVWFVEDLSQSIFGAKQDKSKEDALQKKFYEHSFVLMYNNAYPKRVVFLRMPINTATTITEVEAYFEKLVERFKEQEVQKSSSITDRNK